MKRTHTLFAILCSAIVLLHIAASDRYSQTSDQDYAVPAITDLAGLGSSMTLTKPLVDDAFLNPLPPTQDLKWFDLNHDLQLNDFDIKQFESIVGELNGTQLSGLELMTRFRLKQKNKTSLC